MFSSFFIHSYTYFIHAFIRGSHCFEWTYLYFQAIENLWSDFGRVNINYLYGQNRQYRLGVHCCFMSNNHDAIHIMPYSVVGHHVSRWKTHWNPPVSNHHHVVSRNPCMYLYECIVILSILHETISSTPILDYSMWEVRVQSPNNKQRPFSTKLE